MHATEYRSKINLTVNSNGHDHRHKLGHTLSSIDKSISRNRHRV